MTTINERIAKAKGWEFDPSYQGYGAWFAQNEDGRLAYKAMKNGLPDWSGSIADAWELVEEMTQSGPFSISDTGKEWHAEVIGNAGYMQVFEGKAPTAPEAICLAWLAVNEGES